MVDDFLCFDKMSSQVAVTRCHGMKALVCFSRRRGGGGDLPSGGEEHGPSGSAGLGRRTDCTDVNHLLLKDRSLESQGHGPNQIGPTKLFGSNELCMIPSFLLRNTISISPYEILYCVYLNITNFLLVIHSTRRDLR